MYKNISATMFYSLLFAMGGAPTIAMLIIRAQTQDPQVIYQAFIGLSVILACILAPCILLQNGYLWFKRKNERIEAKIKPLMHIYLVLNILCLIYWLAYRWL